MSWTSSTSMCRNTASAPAATSSSGDVTRESGPAAPFSRPEDPARRQVVTTTNSDGMVHPRGGKGVMTTATVHRRLAIVCGAALLATATLTAAPGDLRVVTAVKSGDRAAVRVALRAKADINAPEPD